MGLNSRRPISSEPLINWVHRRFEWLFFATSALFILYVTTLPSISDNVRLSTTAPIPVVVSLTDLVQNVLLYVPLGLAAGLALRRRRIRWRYSTLLALLMALMLSASAEAIQRFLPGRVSSSLDLLYNGSGTLVGVFIAFLVRMKYRSCQMSIKDQLIHQPIFSSAIAISLLFGISVLVPFQIKHNWSEQPVASAPLPLITLLNSHSSTTLPVVQLRTNYEYYLNLLKTLCCCVLISFLAGCSFREEFEFHPFIAMMLILWVMLLYALLLTAAQALIQQWGIQLALLAVCMAGALCGSAVGLLTHGYWKRRGGLPANWGYLAVLASLTVLLMHELSPLEFDWRWAAVMEQYHKIHWLPFQKYFASGHTANSASDILNRMWEYAVLGMSLAWIWHRRRIKTPFMYRLQQGLQFIMILSILIEVLQLGTPYRSIDLTHVLLAMMGSGLGMMAMQWWQDLLRAYHPSATRRLHLERQQQIRHQAGTPAALTGPVRTDTLPESVPLP
ncbi:MAG: hypothetical protein HJJLKODD_01068 [Phycisphaerae bacterium]|nr:hypothetical protein [Phycisphaerae bacterium]